MSSTETQAEFGQTSFPRKGPPHGISLKNRRSRRQDIYETNANTFATDSAYNLLKEKCENALNLWPNAKAAIFYGSRARKNHRADSDWDIAFITSTKESLPSEVLRDLNELQESNKLSVHAMAIPQNEFIDDASSLGNVVSSIAHEGRLIAGHCEWPDTESKLIMKPEVYLARRAMALKRISSAVNSLTEGIDNAKVSKDSTEFKSFVRGTADAAEYFAKIAFEKIASGTSKGYPYSHKVNDIVKEIDRKIEDFEQDKAKWWKSDHGREFRDLLGEMNGYGHDDHQYEYTIFQPDTNVIARAANRLLATVEFAIREVEEVPGPECLKQVANEFAVPHRSKLLKAAKSLRDLLENLDLNDSTFSVGGEILAKSATVAVNFGGKIARATEDLADSLSKGDGIKDKS